MKNRMSLVGLLLATLCLLMVVTACAEKKGPMEKAGEKMDDAVDNVGDAIEDAGDAVEDAADDVEDAVEGDGTSG